ncbi:uncharacterized protein LOC111874400 isoform X2 [Cryptotermes secundus]|uniref:uncharacterized protein LOC111874400 isoform X2 n=1 Tax=Cryptotermes secundus TaxID=105785 RepID=UPI000CD7B2C8|nr:uncharacterized protein LOC111874400 isoform X2 [Cryptotermes secundus]
MGVCTKMWAASAVVVLAGSCILARPSGPDITDEHRESRAASGFKLSTGIRPQGYEDNRGNGERKTPLHITFSDGNRHGPAARSEEHHQEEQSGVGDSGTRALKHAGLTKQELESSFLSTAHNKRGDADAGIRDEHIPISFSLTSDLNSKPAAAQNEQDRMGLIQNVHGNSPEENSSSSDSKSNNNFDKSTNTDLTKITNSALEDKVKPLNRDDNTTKEQILTPQGHLLKIQNKGELQMKSYSQASDVEAGTSSGRALLASSTRQLINPFENPILTYLTKQQSLEDSNNSDTTLRRNEANAPENTKDNISQNIKREIFHQQTIINSNPYLRQFIHHQNNEQKTNPAYYQVQYPISQQQQFGSFPNTQFLTYTTQSEFPGSIPHKGELFQEHDNQNKIDLVRAEVPQFSSNPESGGNFVTTLTLYPAIASVMYTTPTVGFTSTSSAPSPPSIYPPQSNPPYMQSFSEYPSRSVPSLLDFPKTRFIYNGPQYSSRVQWPFAGYFPIVIKDPFLSMYNMLTNMVEYGPEADVCKKTKSFRQGRSRSLLSDNDESITRSDEVTAEKVLIMENGGWRETGKDGNPLQMERKMPEDVTTGDKEENRGEERENKDDSQNTEVIMETGGKGNGGPFITRLMVRKGGVSIAGPGGIATAGSGGTAIVGPGGIAYTSPNGLAVVGPGGKVVGLPSGADLSLVASKVTASDSNSEGSTPRLLNIPSGGKVVATGPVVYFHPSE